MIMEINKAKYSGSKKKMRKMKYEQRKEKRDEIEHKFIAHTEAMQSGDIKVMAKAMGIRLK